MGIKVLQLISSGGFYGAENVLMELSLELKKSLPGSVIVGGLRNSRSPHLEVVEKCQDKGLETAVFPCRGRFDLKTVSQIRSFIRNKKINIVHSHGYKANIYSVVAAYGLPVSAIATCHNWLGNGAKMKLYSSIDRFLLKWFDRIVAVSEDLEKTIVGSGISDEKVTLVRNGISLNRFEKSYDVRKIKAELGLSLEARVIGTVGRLSEEKGHRHLLHIAEDVVKLYPKTVFLVVGDGPLRNTLSYEFNKPFILFTGNRDDVPGLYQCMEIFVLPSLNEGLPMALLEAMASKLPVVATRVGSVPNTVLEGESGFVVDPGDEQRIKSRLSFLLENASAAKSMGKRGPQIVKESYSSERMGEQYLNVYRELMV